MALLDDILTQLPPGTLQQISDQVGVAPDKVESVIQDSLPALLGGMDKNVQSDDGAASLANALGAHANANPLGDIGGLISGVLGSGILEKVLGGSTPDVSDAIAKNKDGVSGPDVQKILAIVAPLVMAFLAKKATSGGKADSGTVKDVVSKANSEAKPSSPDIGSILGSIFGK
ncbi:DUF937 domain-containing protein [Aeromicrobium sp. P5_D10]